MKPIQYKDTGPAVEDIQRRLRVLGYDIAGDETSSVVFLEQTLDAVTAFQRDNGLSPTGAVGPRTWSTLVDSTFELGDRMLYLRMPYFHGNDVTQLQNALNTLGFAIGGVDGIFGVSTERAVTEFQQNYGINPDGLVGIDTLNALLDLHHMWVGKDSRGHSSITARPQVQYAALLDYYFDFQALTTLDAGERCSCDPATQAALRRVVRYANNLEDAARTDYIELIKRGSASIPEADMVTVLVYVTVELQDGEQHLPDSAAYLSYHHDFKTFSARLGQLSKVLGQLKEKNGSAQGPVPAFDLHLSIPSELLEAGSESSMPVGLQLMASRLLDALCIAALDANLIK
ncbi:MAG: peptidoglycan-binding protein [Coriobacteriia bacterium]|nr:peptidoglycan-binding protein [Coriobacteriia bacterium]MCL2536721.1 peptidoglycan-binding protein [Coriobacteriia bacterium]